MKKIYGLLLFIFVSAHCANAWVAYVNDGDKFSLCPDSLWNKSSLPIIGEDGFKPGTVGYIPTKLGFLKDEWYIWMTDRLDVVVFRAFSQIPICALVNTGDGKFDEKDLECLKRGFDYQDEFSVERAASGMVRLSFMEETLGTKAVDNQIMDNENGYRYYFVNGYLSSAEPLDGLTEFARRAKGSLIFDIIQTNAVRKHGVGALALKEINFQFWCIANMPSEHFRLAYNNRFNYNIALVWFALYGVENKAQLSDFMTHVPDAETIEVSKDSIIMSWGSNIFIFKNDILVSVI